MTSPNPRNVWQWLAFLSPAVAMVICGTALPVGINAAHHRADGERIRIPIEGPLYGLLASSVLSLALGFWLARGETSRLRRVERAMGYGVIIEIGSLLVSFPGCFLIGQISR